MEAAAKIKVPALFVVAEMEELSNNAVVEQVEKDIQNRGVPTGYHIIKDITQGSKVYMLSTYKLHIG